MLVLLKLIELNLIIFKIEYIMHRIIKLNIVSLYHIFLQSQKIIENTKQYNKTW